MHELRFRTTGRVEFDGQRDELKGVPFDRRQAAEALKLYLGD